MLSHISANKNPDPAHVGAGVTPNSSEKLQSPVLANGNSFDIIDRKLRITKEKTPIVNNFNTAKADGTSTG
jgi:hypothetical protein